MGQPFTVVGDAGSGAGALAKLLASVPGVSCKPMPTFAEMAWAADGGWEWPPPAVADRWVFHAPGTVLAGLYLPYADTGQLDPRDRDVRRRLGRVVHVARNPLAAFEKSRRSSPLLELAGFLAKHANWKHLWGQHADLTVECDDLRSDPRGTLHRVLAALGGPPPPPRLCGPPLGPGTAARVVRVARGKLPPAAKPFLVPQAEASVGETLVAVVADCVPCFHKLGGRWIAHWVIEQAKVAAEVLGAELRVYVFGSTDDPTLGAKLYPWTSSKSLERPGPWTLPVALTGEFDRVVAVRAVFPFLPAARLVGLAEVALESGFAGLRHRGTGGCENGYDVAGGVSAVVKSSGDMGGGIRDASPLELIDVTDPDGWLIAQAVVNSGV